VGLQKSDGIGNDFEFIVSSLSSVGIVDVFFITVVQSFIIFSLFLISSDFLVSLFGSGGIDSLGQSIDFSF